MNLHSSEKIDKAVIAAKYQHLNDLGTFVLNFCTVFKQMLRNDFLE